MPGRDIRIYTEANGALAQLGEHRLCKPEVTGSIPVRSTIERPRKRGLSVSRTEDAGGVRRPKSNAVEEMKRPAEYSCADSYGYGADC